MMHKVHNYLQNFVLTIVCLFITLWCFSIQLFRILNMMVSFNWVYGPSSELFDMDD
jgi:hypothetical protein